MEYGNSQLRCIILSSNEQQHKLVSAWLGVSRRVASLTAVQTADSLCHHLSSAHCHLCIIISNGSEPLPPCLQMYPHMRVLVLTEKRKSVNLAEWLQQGATDVVRFKNTTAVQHAISRLIDQCLLEMSNREMLVRTRTMKQDMALLKEHVAKAGLTINLAASNTDESRGDAETSTRRQQTSTMTG